MKAKVLVLGLCGAMLVSSCGTTGAGALTGSYIGGHFGSAIGGLLGGYRGHELGTVIGMTTGAVAGAAVAQAEQDKRERAIQNYHDRVAARQSYRQNQVRQYGGSQYNDSQYSGTDSGFDASNSGDDRLYDFTPGTDGSSPASSYLSVSPSTSYHSITTHGAAGNTLSGNAIEIRNAHFIGTGSRGELHRGETAKIVFELKNTTSHMLYDIIPTVVETTGNKKIFISPSVRIESIAPGQTLRYTAMVVATRSLRNGVACFDLSVSHRDRTISKVTSVSVRTEK